MSASSSDSELSGGVEKRRLVSDGADCGGAGI